MASSYTTALGKIRSALVTAVNTVRAGLVTSSATTFPRVEIGDVTEMKVQDKGYDVRMLYCNIDVISQSYGTSIDYAEQINTAIVGHKTLTVSGFSSIGAVVDNITEIIEPQEGSFTIYRIISRLEITVEPVEIPEVPEVPNTFTDSRDGKVYKTVTIGEQVWMTENLAYLPSVVGPGKGSNSTAYYYVYGYDGTDVDAAKATANYITYGVLYNWPAALTACPEGWHLPSDAEWTQLEEYLIANGYNYDGTTTGNKIAKSMANYSGWNTSTNTGAIGNTDYPEYWNKSGFSALPGGYRYYNGTFDDIGVNGLWWSSTEFNTNYAWNRILYYNSSHVSRDFNDKENGFSVRCLRD